ncbi:GNAT family N-acetyltransferase [Clostridium sp. 19966]|uniref:GNAT family N-acetyltransferase n=1 Tax=Clostridium sp. 19966 TaxID=2768166 RepID=UPI0028DFF696|nr:N-acetyltransferase [Clostridium sp. 19966]MDT8716854.1 GNAT family N-acetyltransferase [Clostridium sp. 19966]
MIRRMECRDSDAIREIDKLCFRENNARRKEGIEGYIEVGQNSSLVYELDGKVVGYNFLHIWGALGWLGPIGVHPEYQGKGVGKELVEQTIKVLKEEYKVSTVALNTMPEIPYNVGFYMDLGFTPLKLSLNMIKKIDFSNTSNLENAYAAERLDITQEENYVEIEEALKNISKEAFQDFDLTSELYLIKNKAFGTVFTLKAHDKIRGIVICYTKSLREENTKKLQIKLAVMDSFLDYKIALDSIMKALTEYCGEIGFNSIAIDANTYNEDICNYLMSKHAFKIERTQIFMTMGKENPFENKNILLLTRLAG